MSKWQVLVGNIGMTLDTDNGFAARREYLEWCKVARTDRGSRAFGEQVTLMRDDEPHQEQSLSRFFVEVIDLFRGKANYCWVDRYDVTARNHREALKLAEPYRVWVFDHDVPDSYSTKRFNARNACICAFVCYWDDEAHGSYSHLSTIPA